jgi:hypothetical protein
MIHCSVMYLDSTDPDRGSFQYGKFFPCLHNLHANREIWVPHLAFQDFLEPGHRTVETDAVAGIEGGSKKRQSLNMIPVKMREKEVARYRLSGLLHFRAKLMNSRPGIKNQPTILFRGNFHTGCVAAHCRKEIIRQ